MITIEINKTSLERGALAQYHQKANHLIDAFLACDEELEFNPSASEQAAMMTKYGVDSFTRAMLLAKEYHLKRFEEETNEEEGRELLEIPSVESSLDEWIDANLIFGAEPMNSPCFDIKF